MLAAVSAVMDKLSPAPMYCPHCGAKYRVVRVEAVINDVELLCAFVATLNRTLTFCKNLFLN